MSLSGLDTHSGEEDRAPALYARIGRIWSALHFILSRTEDPEDPRRSMLDRALALTNSEFGRDPGAPRTGFNGGGGSDHGSHAATFYVGRAIMGAGVRGGNDFGRVDTKIYDARRARERFAPADLLATVLRITPHLARAVALDVMPKKAERLPLAERELVRAWIAQQGDAEATP